MLDCVWCRRPVDLPLGDECRECQERLAARDRRPAHVADPRAVAAYYRGCELVMQEDSRPVTKIAWDYRAVPSLAEVKLELSIFFTYPERLEIRRLGRRRHW